MHLLMLNQMYLLSAACMWETFRFSSGCHDSSGESVLIQFHYFCTPQKANVGMYSRCLYALQILFVYFLTLHAIPIYFILQFYWFLYLTMCIFRSNSKLDSYTYYNECIYYNSSKTCINYYLTISAHLCRLSTRNLIIE